MPQAPKTPASQLLSGITAKERWFAQSLLSALFAFMLFVFAPIEMVQVNSLEFTFGPSIFWLRFTLYALACFALMEGAFWLAYRVSRAVYALALAVLFGVTVALYVQGTYLCTANVALGASDIQWDIYYTKPATINLLVWAAIVLAPVLLLLLRPKWLFRACAWGSAAILVMLASALVFALSINNANDLAEIIEPSDENLMGVSDQGDVVTLMLDTFDTRYMDEVMEKNPEYVAGWDGFTFYHNTAALYRKTAASAISFFTGQTYLNQQSFLDFSKEAFRGSDFFAKMKENGIGVDVYLSEYRIRYEDAMMEQIDNLTKSKYFIHGDLAFFKNMMRMVLYRYAPIVMQPFLSADFPEMIQGCVKKLKEQTMYSNAQPYTKRAFTEQQLSVTSDKRFFKFYHLKGSHFPYSYNRYAEYVEEKVSTYELTLGGLYLVNLYLDQMKAKGVYDCSTIIIMADHGDGDVCSPAFLVKPAGAHGAIQMNYAPTSLLDYRATVMKAFGIDHSPYGRAVDEYAEDEKRDRHFYSYISTWLRGTDIYFDEMTEYIIPDDATDVDNYIPTGVVYAAGTGR